jgi:hypothetical protein
VIADYERNGWTAAPRDVLTAFGPEHSVPRAVYAGRRARARLR